MWRSSFWFCVLNSRILECKKVVYNASVSALKSTFLIPQISFLGIIQGYVESIWNFQPIFLHLFKLHYLKSSVTKFNLSPIKSSKWDFTVLSIKASLKKYIDNRKEELAESAKNKLKHGQLKKLQMFANERQYILSLLKKYFGKKCFHFWMDAVELQYLEH